MATEIGRLTAAVALREELEGVIAQVTLLSERVVRRRLRAANGNAHVRNVLEDAWPWAAHELGELNVVLARDQGLVDELAEVTGLSSRAIRRRLNASHGRTLLRNAFSDYWPESDEFDDEDGNEEDANEEDANEEDEASSEEVDASAIATQGRARRAQRVGKFDGEEIAGRYVVGRRLGKGGFGEVFEAWDQLMEGAVVLKFATNDDIKLLKHEFGQVFELSHPHICAVHLQRDQLTGRGFLVMQHGGRSVEQLLSEDGAFEVTVALHIISCIAGALDFAHGRRVIHHDVSPGNILVDQNGVPRLTDFGVAVTATRRLTTRGGETLIGRTALGYNRGYAAPEMFVGQARRASDQFSLAIVFSSMLDGVIYGTPAAFRRRKELSSAQNRALQKAMHLDPAQRFTSCGDFAAALANEPSPEPGSTSFLT